MPAALEPEPCVVFREKDVLVLNRRTWVGGALMLALATFGNDRVSAQEPASPAAAPDAPSGLTYLVNGSNVSLFWTHATGTFTHYFIEAGPSEGTTFFTFPTSSLTNASLQTQLISAFSTAGVGAGNYYVRVRAANNTEIGPATSDVLLPVTGGCQPPGPPSNPTGITRIVDSSTWGWLQWNPGPGGVPAQYTIVASSTPGGVPIVTLPTPNTFLSLRDIPGGTYYVRVIAQNACGQSAESAEFVVVAPSNSPARTPNPTNAGDKVPVPYVGDLVQLFAQINPGLLQASCPDPNAKYNRNPFLDGLVSFLRLLDERWGYNSKPTRGPADNGGQPVVVAGDEIAYHYGGDVPEGSPNVALIDVISGHCGPNPSLDYRVFTNGEFGRWTAAGRF